jgi:hypothetical protein
METKQIIQKWYDALEFPAEYDGEFAKALASYEIPADVTIETYDRKSKDGKQNLLTFLYLCESVKTQADARGIPYEIVVETLKDIVIWTKVYTEMMGELYLGELSWLAIHMRFQMFRLGRLQFRMWTAYRDMPEAGVAKGDNVMEIHIPRGSKLDMEEVQKSLRWAKEFFATYFPEFHYTCFTCASWLLDEDLKEFLPETSNIIRFGNLFTKVYAKELNCLLSSIFKDDTTEENLADAVCTSSFAAKVKEAVLGGKMFHMTLGFIPK